jgi:hypothetical protein
MITQRDADHDRQYAFEALTIAEVQLIANGLVPRTMQADAYALLHFDDRLVLNALKPERKQKVR